MPLTEYDLRCADWDVYYLRDDNQWRFVCRCSCPSKAKAIVEALYEKGAKSCKITKNIQIGEWIN